ncbi:LamG domain-containing protein [Candidatus Poribacteria bacterium]
MYILKSVKLAITGALVLFVSGILAISGYAAIPSGSVVGAWLLESIDGGMVADGTGNGHDGAVSGATVVAGKFGQALSFDGSDDVVDCGNDDALNLGVFTVTFWASISATQGWNHMISKGDHVGSGTPGSVNWGVMMRSGEARFLYEAFEDVKWTGISAPEVPLNEWQHLAATYDGDTIEFFLNGESLGATAGIVMKLDASRSFLIGARSSSGGGASFFNGAIDDVGLFNTVLSVEDIQDIMSNGLLAVGAAVSPADKFATTWARIKDQH